MRRLRKSVWLPAALAVYAGVMTAYFGPGLLEDGQDVKLWVSVGVEVVVVVGLFFALRAKERYGSWRQDKR